MSARRGGPTPAVVGSHFVKQYYGEVLSKKPVELHRFYKDESTFCHASGTKEEEPVSGLADIRAKIEHLGLGGAMVDLGCGSVDAQPSEGGGVLLMVTGSITISGMDPRQFCQTFFLSRQYQENDRHNYFVRNDIFRFLDVLPEVVQAALSSRDNDEGDEAEAEGEGHPASVASVEQADDDADTVEEAVGQEMVVVEESVASAAAAAADDVPPSAGVDVTQASPVASPSVKPVTAPAVTPAPMAAGAAPPSESQVASSSSPAVGTTGATRSPSDAGAGFAARAAGVISVVTTDVTSVAAELENGVMDKLPAAKAASSSTTSAPAALSPETDAPAPSGPASPVPPPPPPAAPAAPPASPAPRAPPTPSAPMTYASLAKSWATVAAVGGDAAAPSLSAAGGAPASSSSVSAGTGSVAASGNGVVVTPASNGGWGIPDAAVVAAAGGSGVGIAETSSASQVGGASAGGQGSSRPSSLTGKKGVTGHIPHHASPAVAASAAAAREAAAAGNGEILPATSLFVRKVDMTIDKDEMIAHFSTFGAVTGISMNPTRGYAFIDYRNNECVQRALSTKEHYVNRKLLVVEERHSPIVPRSSRDHSGRGGRNGPRGRGIGGRDGREGDRSDRRSTGGRMARGNLGRESLGRENRADSKEGGGFKPRGRAMPA